MKKLMPIVAVAFGMVAAPAWCASPGDVVITEIMQNPDAVSDSYGEWVEIHNTTGSAIDIDGWTIGDGESEEHTINNSGSFILPAGGFLVLGRRIISWALAFRRGWLCWRSARLLGQDHGFTGHLGPRLGQTRQEPLVAWFTELDQASGDKFIGLERGLLLLEAEEDNAENEQSVYAKGKGNTEDHWPEGLSPKN